MGGDALGQEPLPISAGDGPRAARYELMHARIAALLEGEGDWVAAMATVACELHHAFEYYHWTGFYRTDTAKPQELVIGPYQGHLGCLRIAFSRGVCGAAAREQATQLVSDVTQFPGYIACASSTKSEVVVPVVHERRTLAVLDVDSDDAAAFSQVDAHHLERLCQFLSAKYGPSLLST